MKELCIIRHGLAGNGMIDERRDEKRPLTAQGKAKIKVSRAASRGWASASTSSYCLSAAPGSFITLKKGGVLMLEVHGRLKPGDCTLSWLMKPSQLVELSEGAAARGAS